MRMEMKLVPQSKQCFLLMGIDSSFVNLLHVIKMEQSWTTYTYLKKLQIITWHKWRVGWFLHIFHSMKQHMSHFKMYNTKFDTCLCAEICCWKGGGQTVVNRIWSIIPTLYSVGGLAIPVSQVPMDFCIKTTTGTYAFKLYPSCTFPSLLYT